MDICTPRLSTAYGYVMKGRRKERKERKKQGRKVGRKEGCSDPFLGLYALDVKFRAM